MTFNSVIVSEDVVVVVLVLVFVVDDTVDSSVMEVLVLTFNTPSRGQFSVQYPHLPE